MVFIGGYFYDPYFGPYPWWPRGAYPPWYFPVYDHRAEVRISASPRETAVYVDGFYAGIVDDFDGVFQELPLPPGGHRIALYLPGYRTAHFSIYLHPASTFRLRHAMERLAPGGASEPPPTADPVPAPPAGTYTPAVTPPLPPASSPAPSSETSERGEFELRVQPASAVVTIDGQRWMSSDAGAYVIQLPVGSRRLDISLAGYRSFATDIEIRAADAATLNVSLMRER